jgi:hypothetical protein
MKIPREHLLVEFAQTGPQFRNQDVGIQDIWIDEVGIDGV